MNYPLISEYIEAIKSAEDNFKELSYLRPVLGNDGLPVMTSGNFAVVFKMKEEETEKFYALKCFTKEQAGREKAYHQISDVLKNVDSPYLVSLRYLDKELFVDSEQTEETEFPVLLMDWVEGKTLDEYLRENLDDKYALEMLAYRFSQLAQWLIPQPFAHGDLKPDNILVREDGTLVLVDYDGMYVPAMKGQKAREIGSLGFRHPLRTVDKFDEHIDDFPLLSILLSLKAISINPCLFNELGTIDRLLFSHEDYINIGNSEILKILLSIEDKETNRLISLFILHLREDKTDMCLNLLNIEEPDLSKYIEATDDDFAESWTDEYGITYSKDGTRLLKGICIKGYKIKEGTIYICNDAFNEWRLIDHQYNYQILFSESKHVKNQDRLIELTMPDSVKVIGENAFSGCQSLKKIRLSKNLVIIGDSAFSDCESMEKLSLPSSITLVGAEAFQNCTGLKEINLSCNIKSIKYSTFSNCIKLETIVLSNKLVEIGNSAFFGCSNLKYVELPPSVEILGNMVFQACPDLNLFIPSTVKKLKGSLACKYTISSESPYLHLEDNVIYDKGKTTIFSFECKYDYDSGKFLDKYPLWAKWDWGEREEFSEDEYGQWWSSHKRVEVIDIVIPGSIKRIEDYAFWDIPFIRTVKIPDSVSYIGVCAFSHCELLKRIHLPGNLCSPNILEYLDEDIDIVIPKGFDIFLSENDDREIHMDYEDFIYSNIEGVLFSKEELRNIMKSMYAYNVLHYLDKPCALDVFDIVINNLEKLLGKANSDENKAYEGICILLETQKAKVEAIKDSIIDDKY